VDTIPPPELFNIFQRVSIYVDLEGCETPEDVRQRVLRTLRLMQKAVENAKRPSTRRKWLGSMKFLWTIIRERTRPTTIVTQKRKYDLDVPNRRVGFQTAVIDEAIKHPNGLINLSLDYGIQKAKKKLERRQKRASVTSIHRHKLSNHQRNRRNNSR
jgi:hypothetical protein